MLQSLLSDTTAFRGIIDAVPHPIFVKDEETRFVIVNEMMCSLMNRGFDEIVGRTDFDFFPNEQAEVFRGNDLRVLGTGATSENEELFSDSGGKLHTIVTRKKRLQLADGSRYLIGCITDISDFRRAEALVRHLAEHDPLTGLANRRRFSAKIKEAVARSARSGATYSILQVDLDRFKPVNDVHGHTTGDTVLCEAATRISSLVRETDTVARLGGDEFAIICECRPEPGASTDAAVRLAERILDAIRLPIVVGDAVVEISASIGIAQCPADGTDGDVLLHSADIAMYRAKNEGRGTFHFFEEGMDAEVRRQASLEADFRQAVARGDIRPYYQPLVELAEDRLLGFEILARWEHAEAGFIGPDEFIPIAEKLGLISDLTFALLRTACTEARGWPEHLSLALNISPTQLTDDLLPTKVLGVLSETGFPPSRLEVEITESALVSDLDAAKAILTTFQALGIKVSLDDFGTGYSSLFHLRELRFDRIKIDRSFIQTMGERPESAKIVSAILGLTQSLGLPTTAEGIEDPGAMVRMIESGCKVGQGFLFGKAVPASEVPELIERDAGTGPRSVSSA